MIYFIFVFLKANGTNLNGIFNVGGGHQYQIAKFMEWNYQNITSYGNGACGEIKGTTGEIFERPTYKDKLTIFTPDMCKHSIIDYLDDAEADGIMCRRYKLSLETFDNGNLSHTN